MPKRTAASWPSASSLCEGSTRCRGCGGRCRSSPRSPFFEKRSVNATRPPYPRRALQARPEMRGVIELHRAAEPVPAARLDAVVGERARQDAEVPVAEAEHAPHVVGERLVGEAVVGGVMAQVERAEAGAEATNAYAELRAGRRSVRRWGVYRARSELTRSARCMPAEPRSDLYAVGGSPRSRCRAMPSSIGNGSWMMTSRCGRGQRTHRALAPGLASAELAASPASQIDRPPGDRCPST